MARPRKEITDEHLRQIELLAGYGLTEAAIAHVIGVDPATLRRRKHDEENVVRALSRGRAKAETVIAKALFERAKEGDLQSIRWWEMTRAGRSERSQTVNVDLDKLNEAQLEHLAKGGSLDKLPG